MEHQRSTIQLMSRIIELQAERNGRGQGTLEDMDRMAANIDRMIANTNRRCEAIERDIIRTLDEETMIIDRHVERIMETLDNIGKNNVTMGMMKTINQRLEDIDMSLDHGFESINEPGSPELDYDTETDSEEEEGTQQQQQQDVTQQNQNVIQQPQDVAQQNQDVIQQPQDVTQQNQNVIQQQQDAAQQPQDVIQRQQDVTHQHQSPASARDQAIENSQIGDVDVETAMECNHHDEQHVHQPGSSAADVLECNQDSDQPRNEQERSDHVHDNHDDQQLSAEDVIQQPPSNHSGDDDDPMVIDLEDDNDDGNIQGGKRKTCEEPSDEPENSDAEAEEGSDEEEAEPSEEGEQAGDENDWRKCVEPFYKNGIMMHKCPKCGKLIVGNMQNMQTHMERRHLEVPHPCLHCEHVGKTKANLLEHIQGSHPEVKFQCSECDYTTALKTNLTYHRQHYHNISPPEDDNDDGDAPAAAAAAAKVVGPDTWKEYVKTVHEDGKELRKCTECGKSFKICNIKAHVNGHHLRVKLSCDQCSQMFRCEPTLVNHVRCEHPEVHFDCAQCDYTSVLWTSLEYHLNTAHNVDPARAAEPAVDEEAWREYMKPKGKQKYQCAKCGRVISGKVDKIKNHINRHHLKVVRNCEHCPYQGESKAGLIEHTLEHHPEVIYRCSHCPHTTVLAADLTSHLATIHHVLQPKVNTGEDTQPGPGLSERSSSSNNNSDTSDNIRGTFPCPRCKYVANYKANLRSHIKTMHEHLKDQCPRCECAYPEISHLYTHLSNVHDVDNPRLVMHLHELKHKRSKSSNDSSSS